MGWTTEVQLPAGVVIGFFLFATVSRPALELTQPSTQWVPEREADHSPPPSAEVKNVWSCTFTPPIRLHCMVLS
jgi:hypothetical protein